MSRAFYEGLEQGRSIPWAGWLPMFLRWAPLVWALFLAMIAAMAILRKQWNDYERLTYPLVQVPMALTEQDAGGERIAPFFKNPVMWTGFAVPAIWGTLHGLHNYFPETVPIATNVDPIHFILPILIQIPLQHFGLFLFSQDRNRLQPVVFQSLRQRPAHHICRLRRH
ncbi:MAG: hypothetical protein J4F35_23125 [Candidatus Latescibacteria bacterium]|nr:hypothetical protein [Candidatus Latescibacterota bacterium]